MLSNKQGRHCAFCRGLLPSYQVLNHTEVSVCSVDLQDFQRTYVSLAELARRKKLPEILFGQDILRPGDRPLRGWDAAIFF